jgi:outer membrane biosynthesis protein TonB
MLPERHKKKQSQASLYLSIAFHIFLGVAIFFLAARGGVLGKKMKEISAFSVPEEKKKVEPQKPKELPKAEPVKPKEEPKEVVSRPAAVAAPPTDSVPPPAAELPTTAAPAAVNTADFDFNDGNAVQAATTDKVQVYKGLVEYKLRTRWAKPEDIDDSQLTAEVDIAIAPDGRVINTDWKKGSGNSKWDSTVKQALSSVREIGSKPPPGFPDRFTVRFDAVAETIPVSQ